MKLITYNPNSIENVPEFFNKCIDETNDEHIAFVFNDVYENIINPEELFSKYITLMNFANIPYAFYPYYIHFNKIFPESIALPNPRAHIFLADNIGFDVVNQPSYGLLILNLKKLKAINFKFNTDYKLTFYIQDLIKTCYDNKLWISNMYFLDLFNSYTLFKNPMNTGYMIPNDKFNAEKELFFSKNKYENEPINKFIDDIKNKFAKPEIKQETESGSISVVNDNSNANITILNEGSK